MLHELAVDGSGGLEFLCGVAQLFPGLEQLLVKFGNSRCELLICELRHHVLGQELVGDETGALGLGEPGLEGLDLPGQPVVLSPGVLQLGPQRRSGDPS